MSGKNMASVLESKTQTTFSVLSPAQHVPTCMFLWLYGFRYVQNCVAIASTSLRPKSQAAKDHGWKKIFRSSTPSRRSCKLRSGSCRHEKFPVVIVGVPSLGKWSLVSRGSQRCDWLAEWVAGWLLSWRTHPHQTQKLTIPFPFQISAGCAAPITHNCDYHYWARSIPYVHQLLINCIHAHPKIRYRTDFIYSIRVFQPSGFRIGCLSCSLFWASLMHKPCNIYNMRASELKRKKMKVVIDAATDDMRNIFVDSHWTVNRSSGLGQNWNQ